MQSKLQEGNSHIWWSKRRNRTPGETEHDTPGDTHTPLDTNNPAEIQSAPDNATSDTPAPDNAAHAGIVSGPPFVMTIPPQHQP